MLHRRLMASRRKSLTGHRSREFKVNTGQVHMELVLTQRIHSAPLGAASSCRRLMSTGDLVKLGGGFKNTQVV